MGGSHTLGRVAGGVNRSPTRGHDPAAEITDEAVANKVLIFARGLRLDEGG